MRRKKQNYRLTHLTGTDNWTPPGMQYEVQLLDRIYRSVAEGYFNCPEDSVFINDITVPKSVLEVAMELEPGEFIVVDEEGADVWDKLMGR